MSREHLIISLTCFATAILLGGYRSELDYNDLHPESKPVSIIRSDRCDGYGKKSYEIAWHE